MKAKQIKQNIDKNTKHQQNLQRYQIKTRITTQKNTRKKLKQEKKRKTN